MDNLPQPTVITPQSNYQQEASITPSPKKNNTGLIIFIVLMVLISVGATIYILMKPTNQPELVVEPSPFIFSTPKTIASLKPSTSSANLKATPSSALNSTGSAQSSASGSPSLKSSPISTATPSL